MNEKLNNEKKKNNKKRTEFKEHEDKLLAEIKKLKFANQDLEEEM